MRFNHKHYVPMLKSKAGEFRALREMQGDQSMVTPLIDVPPVDWDFEEGTPKKSFKDHLTDVATAAAESWPGGPFFIDLAEFQERVLDDQRHPVTFVFDTLMSLRSGLFDPHVTAIPVTGLGRKGPYQTAVRNVMRKDQNQNGVCLRLEADDFKNGDEALTVEIGAILKRLEVAPAIPT